MCSKYTALKYCPYIVYAISQQQQQMFKVCKQLAMIKVCPKSCVEPQGRSRYPTRRAQQVNSEYIHEIYRLHVLA